MYLNTIAFVWSSVKVSYYYSITLMQSNEHKLSLLNQPTGIILT